MEYDRPLPGLLEPLPEQEMEMAVCGGEPPPSPPVGLGLMSCVKQETPSPHTNETKKKGFHPFRGLRRMFRRRQRTPEVKNQESPAVEARSRSASQLIDQTNNVVHSGLSVSHDSVFCPSQHSAMSSSLSIHQLPSHTSVTAELVDAVRRRRGHEENSDEEDMGLPASPMTHSPTTADVLLEQNMKEAVTKSSHSTCSDGSLLSMASSEMDEDSRTSSKLSLQEKRSSASRDISDDFSLAEGMTVPLSHSAARHKMAVRPKRKHAIARHRNHLIALPATPEVNEEPIVAVTTVRNLNLTSGQHIRDAPANKSASLPAGVTPGDAWGTSSQEGFFTRLLARRSGKKKKNVESRQRMQPLTINATNIPKSQSFRRDEKILYDSIDPPSLPNAEGTCVWVSREKSSVQHSFDTSDSLNTESSFVWVSQEIFNDNSLSIPIGDKEDIFDNKNDEQNNVSINGVCISNSSDKTQMKDDDEKEQKSDVLDHSISCNSSVKCSVVSITVEGNDEQSSCKVEQSDPYKVLSVPYGESASTVTEVSLHNETKCIINEETINDDSSQIKISEKNPTIQKTEEIPTLRFIEHENVVDKSYDDIKIEEDKQKHQTVTAEDVSIQTVDENCSSFDVKDQKSKDLNSSYSKESFKFEIKAITDTKPSNIVISDRKLSLSELSSVFEKKVDDTSKSVTRQKSFSFGKQNLPSIDTGSLRKSFEGVSKIDSNGKKPVETFKCKGDNVKSTEDHDVPHKVNTFSSTEFKNHEKSVEKLIEKHVETSSELLKSCQSDIEIVLRRRPSREILKQKEEEPELLKVFARRSLKVKDVEEELPIKSRDSDKENEDSVSERKKMEYQRSISTEDCILSVHNVCRQRSKTLPELSQQKSLNVYKEVEAGGSDKEDRSEEPRFIRIQQRKEEWEKRAQQAMGK